MKIQYKDYFIEPSTNATDRFDLTKTILRTKKQEKGSTEIPETYEAQGELGFAMTLENCFQQIAMNETTLHFKDSVITINDYLAQYKREKEELKAHIENKTQIKIK